MPLSTEIFVMMIFVAAFPFFYSLLRDPQLGGGLWFLAVFGCLVLSNICTVAEEFWFNRLFNFLEHLLITIGAVLCIVAVVKITAGGNRGEKKSSGPGTLPGGKEKG